MSDVTFYQCVTHAAFGLFAASVSGHWRGSRRRMLVARSVVPRLSFITRSETAILMNVPSHFTHFHSTRVRALPVRVENKPFQGGGGYKTNSAGSANTRGCGRSTGCDDRRTAGERRAQGIKLTGDNRGNESRPTGHFAPGVASRPVSCAHLRREYIKRASVKKYTQHRVCVCLFFSI